MPLFEDDTHVFIVRIWRETRDSEQAEPTWRGVIEHVLTGQRRYVKELDEISAFLAIYIEILGVPPSKPGLFWRVLRLGKSKE